MLPLTLPNSLLSILLLALPARSHASPQPALVLSDDFLHLVPRHTLFFRQLSDLQTFSGALGGFAASPISNSGDPERPFSVDGETFTDFRSAGQRSCDNQFQKCSQRANEGGGEGVGFSVGECDGQKNECVAAQDSAPVKEFQAGGGGGGGGAGGGQQVVASENIGPDPEFPDFDLICEA